LYLPRETPAFSGGKKITMMRSIFTLCCLGLLGGAIAAAVAGTSNRSADWANHGLGRSWNSPADGRYLDCQHSLPLLADADETDDTEELSDRQKAVAAHCASQHTVAGPSPRAARFEATIQHRLANTLNALGVRLQV
jgi:hypothetical protein